MRICVYCASSKKPEPVYREAAYQLGQLLAEAGHVMVYGGGSIGSMGAIADGVLSRDGEIIGIMPHFMDQLEWGHRNLTHLELVDDMAERKRRLLTRADAVVAMPGGCGTLDELFEAITLKRLGIYQKPIILLDTEGFYAPLEAFMAHVINEHFMDPDHAALWQRVAEPADVLPAIAATPDWTVGAIRFTAPGQPR